MKRSFYGCVKNVGNKIQENGKTEEFIQVFRKAFENIGDNELDEKIKIMLIEKANIPEETAEKLKYVGDLLIFLDPYLTSKYNPEMVIPMLMAVSTVLSFYFPAFAAVVLIVPVLPTDIVKNVVTALSIVTPAGLIMTGIDIFRNNREKNIVEGSCKIIREYV